MEVKKILANFATNYQTDTYTPKHTQYMKKNIVMICLSVLSICTAQAQSLNYTRLMELIAQSEEFLDTCTTNMYPPGQLENLRDAIFMAKNLAAGEAKTTELSQQRTKLDNALTLARSYYGKTFDMTPTPMVYDPQRGFLHPGGLHTQADFDRIKQQLADGNPTVTAAYNVLKSAAYASPSVVTYPVETIVRGGGVGENYISAARGATMAYQNGLRWKIEGNEACAANAVKILMAWANTCKHVGGDSNYALAAGLYGYQFAQAAELVRDYEGWSKEDFDTFCQWMLDVWYRPAMGFLRGRNGTWDNAARWWDAPGHYWSNWGLCNAMCILSMGVLLDDVFIYNQGLSFIKHDQCGTFTDPRVEIPIKNDGLAEFWGNLIVTTTESPLETAAYGKLGQMNESGRDGGHAAMALGLAVDVAHQGYNQGDDLFAFMDHRLAAGIEFTAACTDTLKAGIHRGDLPFTEYLVANNGIYYHDARVGRHTEPALEAHTRNYWGSVIGHYEGVKGVKMPFSEIAYNNMGIDGGGGGSTSGGYDHLGYSVLMNTYEPQLCPAEKIPTELSGNIVYNGATLPYNELGGLVNTYTPNNATAAVSPGGTARLIPVLPAGETDTGMWLWDTGETTKELEVTTDRSQMYRVTYTNARGIKSQQCFTIAVQGDCRRQTANTSIRVKGREIGTEEVTVEYGTELALKCSAYSDVDTWSSCEWDTGALTDSIVVTAVRDRDVYVAFINQGGARTLKRFRIHVNVMHQQISVNGTAYPDVTTMIVNAGDKVEIGPATFKDYRSLQCTWSSGETSQTLVFDAIDTSCERSVSITDADGTQTDVTYRLMVRDPDGDAAVAPGNYIIRHKATGLVLTDPLGGTQVNFTEPADGDNVSLAQCWYISTQDNAKEFNIQTLPDSLYLSASLRPTTTKQTCPIRFENALGTQLYAMRMRSGKYVFLTDKLTLNLTQKSTLDDYPFELIPVGQLPTGILAAQSDGAYTTSETYFDLSGRQIQSPKPGFMIVRRTMTDGSVQTKKVFYNR